MLLSSVIGTLNILETLIQTPDVSFLNLFIAIQDLTRITHITTPPLLRRNKGK